MPKTGSSARARASIVLASLARRWRAVPRSPRQSGGLYSTLANSHRKVLRKGGMCRYSSMASMPTVGRQRSSADFGCGVDSSRPALRRYRVTPASRAATRPAALASAWLAEPCSPG
jgi:hypothetical protein